VSTEQRDKTAMKSWEVTEAAWIAFDSEPHITNAIQTVYEAGMRDAHAATMPDREALESNIKESLIASGWVDPSVIRPHWVVKWSAIAADAVLALLNKEGSN